MSVAWLSAMLDWGGVEPADLHCPTLWLVGSENKAASTDVDARRAVLPNTMVQVAVIDGLDHSAELTAVDQVLPVMVAFTRD